MKYEAEIDGRPLIVELDEHDGRIAATIDGRKYDVEVLRPEEGAYLIFVGHQVFEAHAWIGVGTISVDAAPDSEWPFVPFGARCSNLNRIEPAVR